MSTVFPENLFVLGVELKAKGKGGVGLDHSEHLVNLIRSSLTKLENSLDHLFLELLLGLWGFSGMPGGLWIRKNYA